MCVTYCEWQQQKKDTKNTRIELMENANCAYRLWWNVWVTSKLVLWTSTHVWFLIWHFRYIITIKIYFFRLFFLLAWMMITALELRPWRYFCTFNNEHTNWKTWFVPFAIRRMFGGWFEENSMTCTNTRMWWRALWKWYDGCIRSMLM